MKKIIIVRHAKSIQHGYDQDFERTLTDRGQHDAERISLEMVKSMIIPDLIIASPAARTTQTARIFAAASGYPAAGIRFVKKMYSGMVSPTFIEMLQELDDRYNTVMAVGHNPTVYYYMESLLPEFFLDVPTCSTVVIEFEIGQWSELSSHSGKMTHRWIPDLL